MSREHFSRYRSLLFGISLCLSLSIARHAMAQAAVALPSVEHAMPDASAQKFEFISDGPLGSGWDRTDKIARVYFHEELPAFFRRTLVLDDDVSQNGSLSWIFTGKHAGFTVELGPYSVRVSQRYYDSYSLFTDGAPGNYPQKITRDTEVPYTGHPRTLAVVLNSHLALEVWVNGRLLVQQQCLFDVSRHQLEFTAPRTEHDVLSGALQTPQTEDASITVNPGVTYQTMLGFGGSPSIPAYLSLSEQGKQQYWEILKQYNLLIDREYPMGTRLKPDMSNLDNPADASPHYYGDNFPNGEVSNFDYNKRTLDLGGSVIYEMWDLPAWATEPGATGAGKHGVANPEAYARAMVTYCRIAKERTGRPPDIVGIQNEVTQPPQVALQMVKVLRQRLDEAGFASVKIHMADAPFMFQGTERARELRQHPDIWKSIDYAAVHEYDYQDFFTDPDLYDARLKAMHEASSDKPFLATEICINKPSLQEPSYRVAFTVGQLYHKNLTILDSVGLLYCWLILDVEQPTFGASRSLLIPDRYDGDIPVPSSYQLRVLGAFSRHILKGMHRVEASASSPDLLVTAFRDEKGDATLVVLNRSEAAQRLNVQWNGVQWREMERTSSYLHNADSDVPAQLAIQPGEILTLSTIRVPQS
jgi:hypothetical protein